MNTKRFIVKSDEIEIAELKLGKYKPSQIKSQLIKWVTENTPTKDGLELAQLIVRLSDKAALDSTWGIASKHDIVVNYDGCAIRIRDLNGGLKIIPANKGDFPRDWEEFSQECDSDSCE